MSIVEERYSKWLNHENLAPQYKPVLEAMDAEEKNDAFYTTIEFGTAGMRGLLGQGPPRRPRPPRRKVIGEDEPSARA